MVYLLLEWISADEITLIVMQQPPVIQLSVSDPLPAPELAWGKETVAPGLLAIGGGLALPRLLQAYGQGCFPWYSDGQPVMWWCTDPRMVLPCDEFKLHRSLRKILLHMLADGSLQIRMNHDFEAVINHCARSPRPGQSGTWIVKDMVQAYVQLHRAGYAHSVEAWVNGRLAGGLYCIALGQAVFGESMFSQVRDASKIALVHAARYLQLAGFRIIDCQMHTDHLESMGAIEMDRDGFLHLLAELVDCRRDAGRWDYSSTRLDVRAVGD